MQNRVVMKYSLTFQGRSGQGDNNYCTWFKMKRVWLEYIHHLSPSGPHHTESDGLHYLALYVWLADGITQPIRIIQEQYPSTSAPPPPPCPSQSASTRARLWVIRKSEKPQKHSQPLCPWSGRARPWGRSVWRSRDPPARGQRCWASCHLFPQTDQTDVRVTTEHHNPFPATALSAFQQAALWWQHFCSCHSHSTDGHIMEYPTTFLLLSYSRNSYWQTDNYGTTHLPCKWYCQGYLCPFLTLLVPVSANAGILLNWLLLLYWKGTLDGNSWKGTLRKFQR